MNDPKLALRQLLNKPGPTSVMRLSISIGVAVNVTVFSCGSDRLKLSAP